MTETIMDSILSFVLSVSGIIILIIILFMLIMIFCYFWSSRNRRSAFVDQHVVITGGSSGIGKSVAVEAAKRGANVTIVARDPNKLQSAKEEITRACRTPTQKVKTISMDISGNYEDVQRNLSECEEECGPIFMLVNSAGSAMCATVDDSSLNDYKYMMQLNFMGTLMPTKYVIPGMKARSRGHIVFVASQAALVGLFGFSTYSSSKYALRGLGEALQMEVKPYGIKVTVSFPAATDTPGYIMEEASIPPETRLMSKTGGLASPDAVAVQLLDDAIIGRFYSSLGFVSFIITTLGAGMSPVTSFLDLLLQVCFMGLFRLMSIFYLLSFDRIVCKCKKERELAIKPE